MKECVTHHHACDCREEKTTGLLVEIMRQHADPDDDQYNECDLKLCAWCEEAERLIDD